MIEQNTANPKLDPKQLLQLEAYQAKLENLTQEVKIATQKIGELRRENQTLEKYKDYMGELSKQAKADVDNLLREKMLLLEEIEAKKKELATVQEQLVSIEQKQFAQKEQLSQRKREVLAKEEEVNKSTKSLEEKSIKLATDEERLLEKQSILSEALQKIGN